MNFRFEYLAVPCGGAVVGMVLNERGSEDLPHLGSTAAAALAAVVAVLAVVVLSRAGTAAGAGVAGSVAAGAALVSVPLLISGTPGLFASGTGAGLILGGLLVLCTSRRSLQAALAVGVLLGSLGPVSTTPRRYADYLPDGEGLGSSTMWLLLAATVGFTLLCLPVRLRVEASELRALIVGLALPALMLLVHWVFGLSIDDRSYPGATWQATVAWSVVVAAVVGGAVWLPRATGLVLVAGLAIAAVDPQPVFVTDRWLVVVVVSTSLPGLFAGWRWPKPVVGIGLLAVVAGVGLADEGLVAIALPSVAAFVLASSLPAPGGVAVPALLAPVLIVVPYTADVGWTAYSGQFGWVAIGPTQAALVVADVAAFATIAVCALAAWLLTRRVGSVAVQNGG
ncbi:hypothetical protein [Rhodococcus sovatensis]|uniref:Uncharacterized protein n=1 Tax=Rhodococcus sovatensis TaxID=1805840 RepID=A0ABZ2PG25_9NOCA